MSQTKHIPTAQQNGVLPAAEPTVALPLEKRFRSGKVIGGGMMGDVREGTDLQTGEQVALKFLRNTVGAGSAHLASDQIRREIEIANRIDDPLVLKAIAGWTRKHPDNEEEDQYILALPRIYAPTLEHVIAEGKPLPAEKVYSYLRQFARLLVNAQEANAIHRDMHPGNVFAMPDDTYKVTDFGMATNATSVFASIHGTMTPGQAHRLNYRDYANIKGVPTLQSDLISVTRTAIAMLRGRAYDTPLSEGEFSELPAAFRTFLKQNSAEVGENDMAEDANAYASQLEQALGTTTSTAITKLKTRGDVAHSTQHPVQIKPKERGEGAFFFPWLYPAKVYRSMNDTEAANSVITGAGGGLMGGILLCAATTNDYLQMTAVFTSLAYGTIMSWHADKPWAPTPGNLGYWTYQGMKKIYQNVKSAIVPSTEGARKERGFGASLLPWIYPAKTHPAMTANQQTASILTGFGAGLMGGAIGAALAPPEYSQFFIVMGSMGVGGNLGAFADKPWMPTPGNIGYWTYQGVKNAVKVAKESLDWCCDEVIRIARSNDDTAREKAALTITGLYRNAASAAYDGQYKRAEEFRELFTEHLKRFKRKFGQEYVGNTFQVNDIILRTNSPEDLDLIIQTAKDDMHRMGESTPMIRALQGQLETTEQQLGAHAVNYSDPYSRYSAEEIEDKRDELRRAQAIARTKHVQLLENAGDILTAFDSSTNSTGAR